MFIKEKITVCIIAYNEEIMIEKCVKTVMNQKNIDISEILVGVNSSKDNTIKIVEELANIDYRIKVVNSAKGKPNAWNELNKVAKNNIRIFMDGDCWLKDNSIYNLYTDWNNEIIIGGTLKYNVDNVSLLSKIVHFPNILHSNYNQVCGALYLIDYERLKSQMLKKNFHYMPYDIIADDKWIVLVAENVNISRSSIVITNACSISDQILRNKRFYIANQQIRNNYSQLCKINFKNNTIINKYKLFCSLTLRNKILYILILPMKKVINKYISIKSKKLAKEERCKNIIWDKIESSRKV
ncbi:MAG: glycosyltransferase family 2 protein [Clostridium butyricum]|nr:glycosyltransferase family 2 protein [Clostridium butyricum]MDU5821068.1 glycosyltransferase family 2 protein [Clostridium butyricum]